jgi:hypothetical protein
MWKIDYRRNLFNRQLLFFISQKRKLPVQCGPSFGSVSTRSSLLLRSHFLTLPRHRFLSPSFSSTYKSLSPQPLSFLIYTNPLGVPMPRFLSMPFNTVHDLLSALFSLIYKLFCSVAKLICRVFNRMRTLHEKMPGWLNNWRFALSLYIPPLPISADQRHLWQPSS